MPKNYWRKNIVMKWEEMMSNFIGMVFATLKKEGIDTSKMDTSEAIAKYNELKGGEGGSNAKGEETPKQEEKTAETGKETAKKTDAEKDSTVATVAKEEPKDKQRADKYTVGNPDNINKQTTIDNIEKDLQSYKGSGSVDLVLPGGKWCQIRPQQDGSYLARTSNGQKFVSTVDEAKQEIVKSYNGGVQHSKSNTAEKMSTAMGISLDEAKAFASGKGHLSQDGGYNGVSNVKSAPKFEYKSNTGYEKVRSEKIQELMSYGYSQEESEQAFEASVDFWQKQLKCDRETAMKIAAKDRG